MITLAVGHGRPGAAVRALCIIALLVGSEGMAMARTRKNLMVDAAKVRALTGRLGTSESEAVRQAMDSALIDHDLTRVTALDQLKEPEAVMRYIRQRPGSGPLLAEARAQLAAVFGPAARARLAVLTDPEDGGETLCALVVPATTVRGGAAAPGAPRRALAAGCRAQHPGVVQHRSRVR